MQFYSKILGQGFKLKCIGGPHSKKNLHWPQLLEKAVADHIFHEKLTN